MTNPRNIVIAVSGIHGVGKTTQAKKIAKFFGLRHVSGGMIFRRLAGSKNLSLLSLSELAENSDKIDRSIDGAMVEEGKRGDVVVDSMLSVWFLESIANIKIFLTIPDNVRIERIAKRDGKSYQEAYNETLGRESSEINRFKRYYNINLDNVKNVSDLVLSIQGLNEDEVFSILKYYIQIRLSNLGQ